MSRKHRNISSIKPAVIDIVITTAGRFDMLEKCLDAIYNQIEFPVSIYVIDIDSPMSEKAQNEHLFVYHPEKDVNKQVSEFKSKRFPNNVGFPAGANEGARMGKSPLIMILNDDVELQEGAIKEIVNTFVDETVGIVGAKLIFPNTGRPAYPSGKIQHIGLSLNIRGEPVHPLVGWSPSNPRTQYSREAWAVTGACLTIRRSLWSKVGGFDLIYGKGTWEDADLCMKVRQLGKRIYLNNKAWGYHYTGASQEKRKESFPLQQNQIIFQSRWGNSGLLVWDEWSYL